MRLGSDPQINRLSVERGCGVCAFMHTGACLRELILSSPFLTICLLSAPRYQETPVVLPQGNSCLRWYWRQWNGMCALGQGIIIMMYSTSCPALLDKGAGKAVSGSAQSSPPFITKKLPLLCALVALSRGSTAKDNSEVTSLSTLWS